MSAEERHGIMNKRIPGLKMSLNEWREWVDRTVRQDESTQKILVLVIVSIALLLDNMLYMVIVPIIPHFFRQHHVYEEYINCDHKQAYIADNGTKICPIDWRGEEEWNGYLFASKAFVQILVGPISGTVIDRVGYEIPMVIGLIVMFCSTSLFAAGSSYWVLFAARSLQGLGSAFADTSGLAMIADRFQEEQERSKALGVAIAFISFGCLVAPPFGGYMYKNFNKSTPFIILSSVCLFDGFLVWLVIQPKRKGVQVNNDGSEVKGTPIHHLFLDPYIACCSGALIIANVSLAFIEPTIALWLEDTMQMSEDDIGLMWLPAFFPHVAGVWMTIVLMAKYPRYSWLMAAIGLSLEGFACLFLPQWLNFWSITFWLCVVCYGVAMIDTALLPLLGYLVDTRHVSVYGSVYAIADISYSLAYAFGPVVAGRIMAATDFHTLNYIITFCNLAYVPVLAFLRKVYVYKAFEPEDEDGAPPDGNYDTINSVQNEYYMAKDYGVATDESTRLAAQAQAQQGYGADGSTTQLGITGDVVRRLPM